MHALELAHYYSAAFRIKKLQSCISARPPHPPSSGTRYGDTPPQLLLHQHLCLATASIFAVFCPDNSLTPLPTDITSTYLLCSLTRSGAYRLWEKSAILPASGEDPAPHTCTRHICELMIPGPSITPISMFDPTKGAWSSSSHVTIQVYPQSYLVEPGTNPDATPSNQSCDLNLDSHSCPNFASTGGFDH